MRGLAVGFVNRGHLDRLRCVPVCIVEVELRDDAVVAVSNLQLTVEAHAQCGEAREFDLDESDGRLGQHDLVGVLLQARVGIGILGDQDLPAGRKDKDMGGIIVDDIDHHAEHGESVVSTAVLGA